MPRTKITTKGKKEPLSKILKRVGTDRFVVISVAMIVVGLVLVAYSYTFTDQLVTPNKTYFQKIASNQSTESFKFTQPFNVSGKVTFKIPAQNSLHYELYQYFHVDNKGIVRTQYSLVKEGNATNNTVISFTPTYHLQGQDYVLNFTTNNNSSFPVNITADFSVIYVQHSSRYIGGAGLAISISGVVFLAYAITRVFGSSEEYNKKF